MNNEELWQAALGELELSLSKANFTTWFKNTFISSFSENKAIISVPNTFTKTWLEQKYNNDIKKTLQKLTNGAGIEIIYKIEPRYPANANTVLSQEIRIPNTPVEMPEKRDRLNKFGLNPKYTFETF